jgi:hypothetical protein
MTILIKLPAKPAFALFAEIMALKPGFKLDYSDFLA